MSSSVIAEQSLGSSAGTIVAGEHPAVEERLHLTGAKTVAFCHSEDCRQTGHTRIRENGHYPATRGTGGLGTSGHKGQQHLTERSSIGELVNCWECAPGSRAERDAGLDDVEAATTNDGRREPIDNPYQRDATPQRNVHPTVKPIALMRWLVRLITPPGGTVLDPFAGSGSTGVAAVMEGARFLGIEREAEYVPIARARIKHWAHKSRDGRARKAA